MKSLRVPVSVTLRPDILRKVDEHCLESDLSRSRVIERALLTAFRGDKSE
jgi:metal-responsive CopG/Arc/MetJ family transcriptional regulator